jgi:hypothetical protein
MIVNVSINQFTTIHALTLLTVKITVTLNMKPYSEIVEKLLPKRLKESAKLVTV